MARNRLTVLLALAFALPACISKTTSTPDYGNGETRQAQPKDGWKVVEQGRLVGYVMRFEEQDAQGQVLLSVRNEYNQDMGWIDQLGRAWRYQPHADPDWVSTGSTLQGVRQILNLGSSAELEPIELKDFPAGS